MTSDYFCFFIHFSANQRELKNCIFSTNYIYYKLEYLITGKKKKMPNKETKKSATNSFRFQNICHKWEKKSFFPSYISTFSQQPNENRKISLIKCSKVPNKDEWEADQYEIQIRRMWKTPEAEGWQRRSSGSENGEIYGHPKYQLGLLKLQPKLSGRLRTLADTQIRKVEEERLSAQSRPNFILSLEEKK